MSTIHLKLLKIVKDLFIEITRMGLKLKFFKTEKIKYYDNEVGIDFVLTPIPQTQDEESFNKVIEKLISLGFTISEDYKDKDQNKILFDFQGIIKVLMLKSISTFDLIQDIHKKIEEVLYKDVILCSFVNELNVQEGGSEERIYKILVKIIEVKK